MRERERATEHGEGIGPSRAGVDSPPFGVSPPSQQWFRPIHWKARSRKQCPEGVPSNPSIIGLALYEAAPLLSHLPEHSVSCHSGLQHNKEGKRDPPQLTSTVCENGEASACLIQLATYTSLATNRYASNGRPNEAHVGG
jgi:hypothetical protein